MNPTTLEPNQVDPLMPQSNLNDLLSLNNDLKLFLTSARQYKEKVKGSNWQVLQEQAQRSVQQLKQAVRLAEKVLGSSAISSGFKQIAFVASVIKAWPQHPKQKEILRLLRQHDVDPLIIAAIDEAITEDQGSLLGLLHLDLKAELIVMLEAQIEQFAFHVEQLKFALTKEERSLSLTSFLGEKQSDDAMFDPFTKAVMSVSDIELTIVAIVVLASLKKSP